MCLRVSKIATAKMRRKRKPFIAWKILDLNSRYGFYGGSYQSRVGRILQSLCFVRRYRPGVNKSNRKSKAIDSDFIHRGIHVFLSKPRNKEGVIPVIVHPRDFVAAGSNPNGSDGAVFMKVRIRKADYLATVKALRKSYGLSD